MDSASPEAVPVFARREFRNCTFKPNFLSAPLLHQVSGMGFAAFPLLSKLAWKRISVVARTGDRCAWDPPNAGIRVGQAPSQGVVGPGLLSKISQPRSSSSVSFFGNHEREFILLSELRANIQ
jgi:hypothetical protein